ncbi:MAG: DUF3343 domain-containing protein [Pseudomonadota bacterium]
MRIEASKPIPMDEFTIVFVFDSIHHVLKAEKFIKKSGLACELIPVPRQISSDCGMALAVQPHHSQEARELLDKAALRFSVFQNKGRTYSRVTEPGHE